MAVAKAAETEAAAMVADLVAGATVVDSEEAEMKKKVLHARPATLSHYALSNSLRYAQGLSNAPRFSCVTHTA